MKFLIALLVLCHFKGSFALAKESSELVEFTFAYDDQEGFPSFMGNGSDIPKENPGTYIEILRLVEKRVPIKLTLIRLPWKRCKAYLRLNKVDAINSSFRKSRQEIGVFPSNTNGEIDSGRRITSDTYRLYTKKGGTIFFDPLTNQIKNIGNGLLAPMSYSIVADLRKVGVPVNEHPGGVLGIMRMLSLDRATGVIAHENQANFILKKYAANLTDIVAVEPSIKDKHYYILISKSFYKRHPKIAEHIWDAIAELRKSHLPQLLEKYLVQN